MELMELTNDTEEDSDELEYPRELFLGTDLHNALFLQSYGYWLKGIFFTQGTISSITIGGSKSPEGFLLLVLLLVVIIVTVVIVAVILVVVVVAIIRVVIDVVGGVSSIFKLLFVIVGVLRRIVFYYLLHQPLSYGNGFLQSLRF
ncbi:hypothetical protein Tco_0652375 [Tanacetum coccineum]|uniref:Uncharacterized protein n=1 Tax=Tanacetum coccineum TaxID=301880 RepID=A0ABQ4WXG5_9ASTR